LHIKELTLGRPSSRQDGDDKQIFAGEEKKSRFSWNSYGLDDAVKRWSFMNKKNIVIISLMILMIFLLGLNLDQMTTFRADQIENMRGEIQENQQILETLKVARTNYASTKLRMSGLDLQNVTVYKPNYKVITMDIQSRNMSDIDYYKVTCQDSCTNVIMTVESDEGDVALHAEEDKYPDIVNSWWCPKCTLCHPNRGKPRRMDTCENISTEGNQFNVAVTHQNHTGARLRVKGTNLNVTTFSLPHLKAITHAISSRSQHSIDNYVVICSEQCQRTFVTLTMASEDGGDADLCVSNQVTEADSPQQCKLCRSKNFGHDEYCTIPDDPVESKFYVLVHAGKSFTNQANLTITGRNLMHVIHTGTVSPPTTTTTTPNPVTSPLNQHLKPLSYPVLTYQPSQVLG